MQIRLFDVPVDGGGLRVLQWGTGRRVAVAVHGITASAMSWQAVARQMPPGWTLAAPDLRGRGSSAHLPGPYGLERHAADVTAVLRHFGGRPVLAGHSMGAYVALLARDAHPNLSRRLVLVDGGLPLPVPDGVDPEVALEASIGPAIARLRQTFPSTEAYLDFWRAHPALADHWTADVEAYARYDLEGEAGGMRSAGFLGDPPGLLPPDLVAMWAERVPQLRPQLVPDVNHYTILFDRRGAAAVARAITATAA
jgi:pimeloyl-ACP methyl ester carboxylesterase